MTRRRTQHAALLCLLSLAALLVAGPSGAAPASENADVLMFHNDPERTGWDAKEALLTPQSVRPETFGRAWSAPVDGEIYGQPLVVSAVPGPAGPRTLVFIATERNHVYAFDASSGSRVWGPVTLGSAVSRADLPCGNIDPVGITSTPVIDRAGSTLYVVGLTTPDGGHSKVYRMAALELASGRMRSGWPVTIAPPAAAGRFDSTVQQQRGALTAVDGVVHVPFGGYYGDCGEYRGWVVGVPVSHPAQQEAFATPTGHRGGIWAAGGVAADAEGSLYASVGDSDSPGAVDFGNSVLRLSTHPHLSFSRLPRDYFVPSNFVALNGGDTDLGSTTPLVLPPQPTAPPHLLFIAGKQGVGYLIDRDEMGGVSQGDGITGEAVYSRCVFGSCRGGGAVFSAAAYWDAGDAGRFIFVPGRGAQPAPCRGSGGVAALRLREAAGSRPAFDVAWCSGSMRTAGAPAVSSAGAANGLVWVVDTAATPRSAGEGTLYALDALTGAAVFASNGRDAPGTTRQFITPAIAAGRVYVGAGHTLVSYAPRKAAR